MGSGATAVGIIAAVTGCLSAFFVLRGQLGQIKERREDKQREEVWRIVEERKGELKALSEKFEDLQREWRKQAERLDILETQKIRDQSVIEDQQAKIDSQQTKIEEQQRMIDSLRRQVAELGGSA